MWIGLSLLASICFTGIYIAYRYLTDLGITSLSIMVYIFLFGGFLNVSHAVYAKHDLKISRNVLLVLILCSILSYVGNLSQVRSIALAPNPGYAVTVSSSALILFTIVSIFLFGSEFSQIKILGVALCFIGIMLVSL